MDKEFTNQNFVIENPNLTSLVINRDVINDVETGKNICIPEILLGKLGLLFHTPHELLATVICELSDLSKISFENAHRVIRVSGLTCYLCGYSDSSTLSINLLYIANSSAKEDVVKMLSRSDN